MNTNQAIPFSEWWIALIIPLILAGRYFLMAGIAYLIFYYPGFKFLKPLKIQPSAPKKKQIRNELIYSLYTIIIFSLTGILGWWLYINGHTTIYHDINDRGIGYLFLTVPAILILHDTYFYWTHRLLHTKWLFKKVHAVHHRSVNPTPWAAYSFHPFEALIESLFIFPVLILFPIHIYAFLVFILLTLVMNVIGHLGFELIPGQIRHSVAGSFLSSSTHHNLHHQKNRRNYGYYFTIWDKIMSTLQDEKHSKKCRACKHCTNNAEKSCRLATRNSETLPLLHPITDKIPA